MWTRLFVRIGREDPEGAEGLLRGESQLTTLAADLYEDGSVGHVDFLAANADFSGAEGYVGFFARGEGAVVDDGQGSFGGAGDAAED